MDQNSLHRARNKALGIAHGVGLFLAMLVICLPGIWIVLSSAICGVTSSFTPASRNEVVPMFPPCWVWVNCW